jgi:hypothetical protein
VADILGCPGDALFESIDGRGQLGTAALGFAPEFLYRSCHSITSLDFLNDRETN